MTEVVMEHLHRLHPDIFPPHSDELLTRGSPIQNVTPVLFYRESTKHIVVVEPYIPCSLHTASAYSAAIFSLSYAKPLFVLYQVLHAVKAFHQLGLTMGDLSLQNVLVDDKLWVYVSNIDIKSYCNLQNHSEIQSSNCDTQGNVQYENENKPKTEDEDNANIRKGSLLSKHLNESDSLVNDARLFLDSVHVGQYEGQDLCEITDQWCKRKLTNFKYIMILNLLAGRRMGDPNHHPVLPWVMDFTESDMGFRDLTLSKFRLNKGDNQLDLTFETFSGVNDSSHIPHHVSDVLSDITYYVYKARRTPKSMLCAHVRSKWVPNEYPTSMLRMQEWTPDECIPEFFTDPTIFTSIHEDLPDLELPPWSSGADDFIARHMAVLESDAVSEMLHHWIDLTFGYKVHKLLLCFYYYVS